MVRTDPTQLLAHGCLGIAQTEQEVAPTYLAETAGAWSHWQPGLPSEVK